MNIARRGLGLVLKANIVEKACFMQKNRHGSSSRSWLNRHVNDEYVKRSEKEDTRSRAYYKLEDINQKCKLISRNPKDMFIVDIGAAPGGWSLYCSKVCTADSSVISLDLLPMKAIQGQCKWSFIQGDFLSQDTQNTLKERIQQDSFSSKNHQGKVHLVLSDMLHNVTGSKSRDHLLSIELAFSVFDFAKEFLIPEKGSLVIKYIKGEEEKEFIGELKSRFQTVKLIKPSSSRKESAEIYVVATGFRA